jgi:DNA-binding transcriptional MerR regulator
VASPPAPALLKIGEVCDRVGLSLRTVRYYEEVGLVEPLERSPGGFRLYSEAEIARLKVLKSMKPFGLTLDEIRELMDLLDSVDDGTSANGDSRDGTVHALRRYAARAEARIAQLESHVAEVRRLQDRILAASSEQDVNAHARRTTTE